MRYRKKPVVIEAVQWTGDNLREVIDFTGLHPSAEKWSWDEYEQVVASEGLKIFTLEGPLMAAVGDWIIRGVQDEFYPCKPDIFAATYELAEERNVSSEATDDLKLALELAENFYDGTDYQFDRLTPDEQGVIIAAARAHLVLLKEGA